MKRSRAAVLAALIVMSLSWGCASAQLAFLDRSVADSTKAKMLTDAGIDAYNERLVQAGDLSQVGTVKEYFINALRFDPGNSVARRYLALASGFKAARFQDLLGEAQNLARKQGRSDDETLKLCILVNKASEINARDPDFVKLQKDVAPARASYVDDSLAKGKAALDKRAKATDRAKKDALTIVAFQYLAKASSADPTNGKARGLLDGIQPSVKAIAQEKLNVVPSLLSQASYTRARSQIDVAAGLNAKLGGAFDAQIQKAYYDLYYAWAGYFYDKRDYAQAEIKVNAALTAQKSVTAQNLRKKILALKAQTEQGADFEGGIAIVDGLMKRGSISQAAQTLNALSASATDKGKREQIEEYRAKIRAALADRYAKGVAAYQTEKFDDAIDALDDIVSIDPGYQQAADYLEKARAKQQVLLDN